MADSTQVEREWQVVVIGAGPAGTATAIACARLGLRVLLVDAKRFPRRKVCGGCLNQVSMGLLRELLGEEHMLWNTTVRLDAFQLTHRNRQFRFNMPPGCAVERSAMDQSLVDAARQAGVTFVDQVSARVGELKSSARGVLLSHASGTTSLLTKVVVVASGLGNRTVFDPSVRDLDGLQQSPAKSSRVGIEAIFSRFPEAYAGGVIHMVLSRHGYVGLTQIADERLHVAAAVDRGALQSLGPAKLIAAMLAESGATELMRDDTVTWRGTPPLTASADRLAAERVFLVGDAAGYVEPFTGEGIRWALESGMGVAPLVARAAAGWKPSQADDWCDWYRERIGTEQRLCRRITSGLKQSATRWLAHQALRMQPRLASMVIARINSESPS